MSATTDTGLHCALHGLTAGTARHDFICARMERMGEVVGQLAAIVGIEEAVLFSLM